MPGIKEKALLTSMRVEDSENRKTTFTYLKLWLSVRAQWPTVVSTDVDTTLIHSFIKVFV